MTKKEIISDTVDILEKLPKVTTEQIHNLLVQFYKEKDEELFEIGFKKLINDSFQFLINEPDLYTLEDCIERYR